MFQQPVINAIKITKVPENLFKHNKELLFVEFGRNQITELPRYLFRSNAYLDEVSLFYHMTKLIFKLDSFSTKSADESVP